MQQAGTQARPAQLSLATRWIINLLRYRLQTDDAMRIGAGRKDESQQRENGQPGHGQVVGTPWNAQPLPAKAAMNQS